MSLFDFMKNIFGFPKQRVPIDPSISDPRNGSEFKKPVWIDEYVEEDDDIMSQQHTPPTFPVLSDMLEIHRYFEQQMEHMQEMMKKFSTFSHSPTFDENDRMVIGAIEPPDAGAGSLRDGYLKQPDGSSRNLREDSDLDSRVGAEGLGGVMGDILPHKHVPSMRAPKFHFYGESVITKTIRKPDGTVETRTIKKQSDGTEEIVVQVQKPDGSVDIHDESSPLPRIGESSLFPERGPEDGFLFDIFNSFLRRN